MRCLALWIGLLPLIAQEAAKPEPAQPEQKPAAAEPAPSTSPALTGNVDVGYRWLTDVRGNLNTYRSVVNLGEGVKLLGFDLNLQSPTRRFFDKITLSGSGWGDDPYTTAKLTAFKERAYDLTADYRNLAYFNFLPSFANPLIDRGILLPQRAYDIDRRLFDVELRLRPGTRIIPYLAYDRSSGSGRGITNFVAASNEYPVFNNLDDHTDRYRGGVNFEFTKFHVTLEQGGTRFRDDQTASTADRNLGNRTTPLAGQQLVLDSLSQSYQVSGDSVFSRGLVTFTPVSWLDLSGQFLYSRPQTDVRYNQTNTGRFVDLSTLQFFTSQTSVAIGGAEQPHKAGNINIELRPFSRLRILHSWMTDRYETDSSLILSDLTPLSTQALQSIAADRLVVSYNRQRTEAIVDLARWLSLRGGYRQVWGSARVRSGDVSGLLFERQETKQHAGLAGAQFRLGQKLWINADAEIARAERAYFRTSLYDYHKVTLRGRYQALKSLSLTASTTILNNENPTPGVNYDFDSHQTTLGFFWNPGGAKRISLHGEYTRSSFDSSINYFVPQTLTPELSHYVENAHAGTALVEVNPLSGKHAPRFSVGGSFFTSSGSRPTQYYQPQARLSLPLHERVQLFSDWRWYGMSENFYVYEGFRTHLFVVGLRVVR